MSFSVVICHLYILFSEMFVDFFCPFSNWFLLLLNIDSSLYILGKSFSRCVGHKCFLPVCSFSFHYFNMVLPRAKVLKWVPTNQFFLLWIVLLVSTLRTHCLLLGPDDYFFFLSQFRNFALTYDFQLIVCKV